MVLVGRNCNCRFARSIHIDPCCSSKQALFVRLLCPLFIYADKHNSLLGYRWSHILGQAKEGKGQVESSLE